MLSCLEEIRTAGSGPKPLTKKKLQAESKRKHRGVHLFRCPGVTCLVAAPHDLLAVRPSQSHSLSSRQYLACTRLALNSRAPARGCEKKENPL